MSPQTFLYEEDWVRGSKLVVGSRLQCDGYKELELYEDGTIRQGLQAASRSWKRPGHNCSLKPLEVMQPYNILF